MSSESECLKCKILVKEDCSTCKILVRENEILQRHLDDLNDKLARADKLVEALKVLNMKSMHNMIALASGNGNYIQ